MITKTPIPKIVTKSQHPKVGTDTKKGARWTETSAKSVSKKATGRKTATPGSTHLPMMMMAQVQKNKVRPRLHDISLNAHEKQRIRNTYS
jgi:hypothetical protein